MSVDWDVDADSTADRLAHLVESRTTVPEVSGSSSRPDQHSGS